MKKTLIIAGILFSTACSVQLTDSAAQAIERARVAEASLYAPQEYALAEDLFNQMNTALDNSDIESANEIAPLVVEKANIATELARQNKAKMLIAQLTKSLQRTGINEEYPEIYSQASSLLLEAGEAYRIQDYEQAIISAQQGLDLLEPLTVSNSVHRVLIGDTLWDISNKFYQTPLLWMNIWEVNKFQIENPHLIYPNQQILIPNAPPNT